MAKRINKATKTVAPTTDVVEQTTESVITEPVQTSIDDRINSTIVNNIDAKKPLINVKGFLMANSNIDNPNYIHYNVVVNQNIIGKARKARYSERTIEWKKQIVNGHFAPVYMSLDWIENQLIFQSDFLKDNPSGQIAFAKANTFLQKLARHMFKNPEFTLDEMSLESVGLVSAAA